MEDELTPIDDEPTANDEATAPQEHDDDDSVVVVPEDARERLAHEAAELGHHLEELAADEADLDETAGEDPTDAGLVAAEQGEHRILAQQLRDQLDDVERALARIEDGTYGQCEVCGEPIEAARLDALPSTRVCIDHAS